MRGPRLIPGSSEESPEDSCSSVAKESSESPSPEADAASSAESAGSAPPRQTLSPIPRVRGDLQALAGYLGATLAAKLPPARVFLEPKKAPASTFAIATSSWPSCITPSCISLPSCISCRRRRLELVLHREPERRMRSVEVTLRCVALRCGRTRPLGEPRFVSQLYRLAKRPRERSGPPSLEFRVAFKATCALNGPVREGTDITIVKRKKIIHAQILDDILAQRIDAFPPEHNAFLHSTISFLHGILQGTFLFAKSGSRGWTICSGPYDF